MIYDDLKKIEKNCYDARLEIQLTMRKYSKSIRATAEPHEKLRLLAEFEVFLFKKAPPLIRAKEMLRECTNYIDNNNVYPQN